MYSEGEMEENTDAAKSHDSAPTLGSLTQRLADLAQSLPGPTNLNQNLRV